MISVEDTYPGRSVPSSANYPEGAVLNETVPNSSDDGTPLDELWGNDTEGLKQAIARSASIVPTAPGNVPDTAISSQILQGLIEMMQGRAINYDDSGVANAYVLDAQTNQQAPASLFDGQIFEFVVGNSNTLASTVNPVGFGLKNIINTSAAGTLTAGDRVRLRYRLGTDNCEILSKTEIYRGVAGGTVDVITASLTPPLTALVDGVIVSLRALGANLLTSTTFNADGTGGVTIVKNGRDALRPSDIFQADHEIILKYNAANVEWELLNPSVAEATESVTGIAKVATQVITDTGTNDTDIVTPLKLALLLSRNVGESIIWNASTPPTPYLIEDGSAVSRTTYANLFTVIGVTFGNGDGSTTFNLPDKRGEFIRGWDNGRGADPDAAGRTDRGDGTTGDNVGTKQGDELESHSHTIDVRRTTDEAGIGDVKQGGGGTFDAAGRSTNLLGGNETRPRNLNVVFCIRY